MSYEERVVNRAEKFKDLALKYLNENYDDTFTARGYTGKGFSQSYRTVTFRSEKYADYSAIIVKIYDDDNGGYYFVDNYYHCYMYDDAVDYFENLFADNVVDDVGPLTIRISFPGHIYSDELNGATSFAEWVANGNCYLFVYFITQDSISDENMEKIVQNIADNKILRKVFFITTSSIEDVIDLSISEIQHDRWTYIESEISFTINYEFEIEKNN